MWSCFEGVGVLLFSSEERPVIRHDVVGVAVASVFSTSIYVGTHLDMSVK